MKKSQIFTIAAAALVMGLSGCAKETGGPVPVSEGQFGEPTWVDITLKAPVTRGVTGEKENGVGNENLVTVLEFYIFDETGNVLDPAVTFDGAQGYYKIEKGTLPSVALEQKLKVSASATGNTAGKKMIIAANMNLGPTADAMNTYAEVSAALSTAAMVKSTDPNTNVRAIPAAGLEMSGATAAVIQGGRGDNAITMTIARLVNKIQEPKFHAAGNESAPAAIDLSQAEANALWGFQVDGTTPKVDVATATVTFGYEGFVVINGLSKSNVRFTGNASGDYKKPEITGYAWDTWSTTGKVYQASEFDGSDNYTNVYSGKYGQGFFLDSSAGVVYAFENSPAKITLNNISGYDADQVYSFIIKGKLTANGSLASAERYWRVNLIKDNNYHMMRNMVYKTTITTINTPGYATPKDAEDSVDVIPEPGETAMDVTVDIAPWDVNTYETQM